MERIPEPPSPERRQGRERLVVSVSRAFTDLDPERHPDYSHSVEFLRLLAIPGIGPGESITTQRLREYGLTSAQLVALTEAARRDAEESRYSQDSHTARTLAELYRQERDDVDALLAHGEVVAQAKDCAEAVVGYVLDHRLAENTRRSFDVRLYGPIAGIVEGGVKYGQALTTTGLSLGVYHPARDTVTVRLSGEALERGSLQSHDRNTLIHEMVHATSPSGVKVRAGEDGTPVYTRLRSGFASRGRFARRVEEYALVGLNEGVTETLARRIGEEKGIPPDRDSAYQGFITDAATLRERLGIGEDELFRLYHDRAGTLKLGRMLRERTELGPHALALFDIFSQAHEGGFTAFLQSFQAYRWQLPQLEPQTIEVPAAFVETTMVGGPPRPIYPPLTAELLERSFPFVRVVRPD